MELELEVGLPNIASEALRKLTEQPELRRLVVEIAKLVDNRAERWVVEDSIELLLPHEDPDAWMLLVVRHLSLPVQQVINLSLQIGEELSKLLESGTGIWGSPQWSRVSFIVEPGAERGPA